ncbi:MAG: C45 family peptidase [Polyangia bacterium]|nr:C45 family peptidase [Polyangia bacterium]
MEPLAHRAPLLAVLLGASLAMPGLAACSDDDGPKGKVEMRDHVRIVWLRGTPYEMGLQHAELLREELAEGRQYVGDDPLFSTMLEYARIVGLDQTAAEHSFEGIVEECQGLAEGTGGVWSLEDCLILNYGDVVVEVLKMEGIACSQFVASGTATVDGELLHGRNLDWWEVEIVEKYPVVFVREPKDRVPWVSVGFPANMSPYTGMNQAGIAVASNEVSSPLETEVEREGRSNVQMVREVLERATTLEEAEAYLRSQDRASAEILVVSDGPGKKAAAFEMTAHSFEARYLSADGVVYAANHFVHADMEAAQEPEEPGTSSWNRFERLRQLLEPGEPGTYHGQLDPAKGIEILRDRYNPTTETYEDATELNGRTLATNGTMQSVIFLPAKGIMWLAVGEFPSTLLSFMGFSVGELTGVQGAPLPDPASFPAVTLP